MTSFFSRPGSGIVARCAAAALALAALGLLVAKTLRVETDFSSFLPPSAAPEQRLLVSQLREGLASRLMLVALQGADERELARVSKAAGLKLSGESEFDYVANGSLAQFAAQGELLMRHRYALSPEVNAERFQPAALRGALEEQLEAFSSPLGALSRQTLARDPTGEWLAVLRQFELGTLPKLRNGVWFSNDGQRAFLIAQTRAPGFDSVRQASAMRKVKDAVAALNPNVEVTLSGPGVFAAESHRLIERDAWRLSVISGLAILAMLVFVYRSAFPIVLILLPTAFGLLAGVIAVQWLFGSVQAITLGFAATLIGEAVDYPSYLLLNTARGEPARGAARRIGGTLTLAVLTTVASAVALTLSSFSGLAQLGVLTMVGITVAGLITHRLIPWLLDDRALDFRRPRVPGIGAMPRWLGAAVAAGAVAGAAWLAQGYPAWWDDDLGNISPVPVALRIKDGELRREMGAPEVSFFLASRGASEAKALEAAHAAIPALRQWKAEGWIASFDSPAWYLPPAELQVERLRALPDRATLETRLREALRGMPFRADAFAPFVADVAAARGQTPVTRATFAGTPLGAKLSALVIEMEGQWLALTPLGGVSAPDRIAAALASGPAAQSRLVNLKQMSAQMLDNYRGEAMRQAGLGALLITALLLIGLRSVRRLAAVLLPVATALAFTVMLLVLLGQRLGVFHLVALLLVLGIGLNYALFFERPPTDADELERTRLALLVCSVSTVITFGVLACSVTPVLNAIGSTVALGSVCALLCAALWARPLTPVAAR
jgi:predicted exporter